MKKNWWKGVAVLLLTYVVFWGLLGPTPRQPILNESIRNVYFHVPLWFGMVILLLTAAIFSGRYLRSGNPEHDRVAVEFTNTALVFGLLGCLTGSIWANFTWGEPWPNDPKLNSVAVGMLLYLAYVILRGSFDDEQRRARISSVYNIFAFAVFIPLIFIVPRLTDSLHPGNGGNPAFGQYDMDNQMRMVFYPAVIGFTLLGVWITEIRVRTWRIEAYIEE
ncbi:ABC transporter permease [Rudanella paleaurantiibacter]|uniref:Heme exporter protein C n=1 Tax=Rudanella paleaurantiibacter TaxID=2614655 RepID=A0A7J5U4R3_9BACT|nr:cytochrome c biogenesis protein [Rudanella paleaurantiibacter]KAB7732756.1 ABC transporter permease [Rudanella paleaurantiibacter]